MPLPNLKRYKNPYGNGFVFPEQNLVTQEEIYICETAKKRFNTGRILTLIGYIITIVLLFFLFMTLFTGGF